jgi:hypothetical protein
MIEHTLDTAHSVLCVRPMSLLDDTQHNLRMRALAEFTATSDMHMER